MSKSKYLYAIIEAEEPQEFVNLGIGGRGDKVYTIHQDGLAVVVSSSPIVKYPVSRENTLVHQKVLEEVLRKFTLLPVRYGTIAEEKEEIKEKVLKARHQEFKNLLKEMKDKVELGVRAIWANMEEIFVEIVEEDEPIKQLKEKIVRQSSEQRAYAGKIKIGEMIKAALEKKKEEEKKELLKILEPLSVDTKVKEVYGDRNILSAAFLVKKTKEKEFDQRIKKLEEKLGERTRLKYFGPVPPYNFVEVVVAW